MKIAKIKNSTKEYEIGKIVCIGRNYTEHAKELGHEVPEFPMMFMKPASALVSPHKNIIHPDYSNDLQHEVELVLLIDKTIRNVNREEAEDAVAGYAVGLDMTLRDIQTELKKKGMPWTLSKCFDTSAVISPFILKNEYTLRGNEKITLEVNGVIRQDSTLDKMIFSPAQIVEYIASKITLEKGDLIYTGTPAGVSRVIKGDVIKACIENVGELTTQVI
jgi:5-carboxymethyl-2-hydroxymuconate isomerase